MNGMIVLDSKTRNAIIELARDVFAKERDRQMEEVWLSKKDFLKQFGMFTEDWLDKYGYLLPHCHVTLKKGNETRSSRVAYARNEIQRMILEDRLDFVVKDGKARGGRKAVMT